MALTFLNDKQNKQNFQALLASKATLMPFVGAGFSCGPCPGWLDFLAALFEQAKHLMTDGDLSDYQSLKAKTDAASCEAVLDLLFNCAGNMEADTLVKSLFDLPLPTEFKAKFACFHQAFKGPWVTTNVDRFIELSYPSACVSASGKSPIRLNELLNQQDQTGLLLKIHGDVREPKSWVLSKPDYQEVYDSPEGVNLDAPLPAFLKRLFTNHSIVFIGCSLQDDRPLKVLEAVIAAEGARQHFALLRRSAVINDEQKLFARRLSNLYITPIWFDDFADIEVILQQLSSDTPVIEADELLSTSEIFVGREKELKEIIQSLQPGSIQTLAALAVCAPGPVPQDFLQLLSGRDDLLPSLHRLMRFSWCHQSTKGDMTYYELHQLVREYLRQQLVDKALKAHHTDVVHQAFIEEPEHFLILERWLSQTDLAVEQLRVQGDWRLSRWASAGFCQFCERRGHGERFVNICQWVRDCFSQDQDVVAMALGNQALVLKSWEQLDEAMNLHKKEEVIYESLEDRANLSECYGNQALILAKKGQLDEAMDLHKKEEAICRDFGDRAGLSRSYGNQALILKNKGQLDKAMVLHKKQEVICEDLGDRTSLSACYGNQASILVKNGQMDEALVLYKKNEVIKEALGDRTGLSITYWNQGCLYATLNNPKMQRQLWVKSIAIKQVMGLPTKDFEKYLAELEKSLK